MNDIKKLKHTVYYYGANFSCFPAFFNSLDRKNNEVKKYLIDNEYKRLVKLSKNEKMKKINLKYDNEEQFLNQFNAIIKSYRQFFNISDYPKLFIVDKFPKDFSKKEWDSMSIDKNDEKHFLIPRGIYYKKQYLTHGYFEFIIAHEIVHWIISEYSKEYFPYVPIIEEGVCDFIGTYILLKNKILEANVIENLVTFNRSLKDNGTLWKQYWKSYLSLSSICYANGIDYIIETIKKGRNKIGLLANNNLQNITQNNIHNSFDVRTIINILLKTNSISVVNTDEYFLLEYINNNFKQEIINLDLLSLNFSQDEILVLFKKIEKLGYVHFYEKNCFYNPNINLMENIKYLL